jgi:hypothetical protein
MERFRGVVRYFRPEQGSGLAVVDIPAEIAEALGGLRQMKVRGSLNGAEFASNVMPAGGGVLALSVNKKLLGVAGAAVGDEVAVEVERIPQG